MTEDEGRNLTQLSLLKQICISHHWRNHTNPSVNLPLHLLFYYWCKYDLLIVFVFSVRWNKFNEIALFTKEQKYIYQQQEILVSCCSHSGTGEHSIFITSKTINKNKTKKKITKNRNGYKERRNGSFCKEKRWHVFVWGHVVSVTIKRSIRK